MLQGVPGFPESLLGYCELPLESLLLLVKSGFLGCNNEFRSITYNPLIVIHAIIHITRHCQGYIAQDDLGIASTERLQEMGNAGGRDGSGSHTTAALYAPPGWKQQGPFAHAGEARSKPVLEKTRTF